MSLDKYQKLKETLLETSKWPLIYMFKFIVVNSNNRVEQVVALLPKDAQVSYKHTKNLKHVSITCKARMTSADAIIDLTEKVTSIEGVFSL